MSIQGPELAFMFRATRQSGEGVSPHHHQCYELVYYVSGEGTTHIGDREWAFLQGEYAIIRPHTVHSEQHHSTVDVICIGLAAQHHDPPLEEGVFNGAGTRILPTSLHMLAELQEQQPRSDRMLELLASQLRIELQRRHASLPSVSVDDSFRYTLNYMKEHFTQKIDFAALAALAGFSSDYYRHRFKAVTGRSPMQYILDMRLGHARMLLQHTALTVTAIAMECGFSNDAQFCSLFKRECGCTPGQFRKRAEE